MVKEGYYFGLPPLVAGGAALLLHWYLSAAVLVFLALFVFSFFRDPDRVITAEPGAVVSPADGRVVVVTEEDRKSTRLNSSHGYISYAVFCLKKKKRQQDTDST